MECMCCGQVIKEVSPEKELCLECYDDVVVPEEEMLALDMDGYEYEI